MSPAAKDARDIEEMERLARRLLALCSKVKGERVDAKSRRELLDSLEPTADDYAAAARYARRRKK